MTRSINGYATDIPYLRDFKPMLAPAWLDHVALVAGIEPPVRQDGFAWCDLGCGQGVTAVILAATHPTGAFHGIDAMPVHIDHARRLATARRVWACGHSIAQTHSRCTGLRFSATSAISRWHAGGSSTGC